MIQRSETPTIVFAVLLGILFNFLLLGTSTSSKQTLAWEGFGELWMKTDSLPHFVIFDQGSWFSLPLAESVIGILFFVCLFPLLLSRKGKYFYFVILNPFNPIWSMVARGGC